MAPRRRALRALAARAGILASYRPMGGAPERPTADATNEVLLAAMGFDASSERAARLALEAWDAREREQLLPRGRVEFEGSPAARRAPVRSRAPRADYRVELESEDGAVAVREGQVRTRNGHASLPLPHDPGRGVHRVRVQLGAGAWQRAAEQRLFVAPRACASVRQVAGQARSFGWVANLYSLRSRRNWGTGDLSDLRRLAARAAAEGAAFVGVNPLHALWNRGERVSPYSPLSRIYRNELSLDVEAVPELAECPAARARLRDPAVRARLERLRASDHVAYDEIHAAKRAVLRLLHEHFARHHRDAPTGRGRASARYREREGEALERFATFAALAEHHGTPAWRRWPAAHRDPRSAAVRRFGAAHAGEIDYHAWVQFELDRQLESVARSAERRGLRIGLYQDLAVGAASASSDSWCHPELFADGATIGAPPDDFSSDGQDWSLPPLVPHALVDDGFDFWLRLLRASFAHAGALRIDHVMGLQRLFWVPAGGPPSEGAYVAYPARELLGILALESRRAGALVVGEDLGTLPRGLRPRLAERGILASQVLVFERSAARFRPARSYSRRALVTANTHDLPPLAGFAAGTDLALRRSLDPLAQDGALDAAGAEREAVVAGLRRRLAQARLLPAGTDAAPARLTAAVYAFLSRTPSPLLGIALDDLGGETEPVNLPGVSQARHPSWTRRMRVPLERLAAQPAWTALASALRTRRMGGASCVSACESSTRGTSTRSTTSGQA